MAVCIGLLGLYASRNLGDAAIQLAVIANLRRLIPGAEFVGICPDPQDTRQTFGIDAVDFAGRAEPPPPATAGRVASLVPWRIRQTVRRLSELPGVRRCLSKLDLLVLSGGGQLDEFWGGAWNHPAQLYAWTHLARRRGVPCASLGLGLDVLESRSARYLCVSALRACNIRTFRDTGTAAAMVSFGLRAPYTVIPDLAFGLELPVATPEAPRSAPTPLIGVATISQKALAGRSAERHDAYLSELAAACATWLRQGARLRFVCSQPPMDRPVVDGIVSRLGADLAPDRWEIAETPTVEAYLHAVRGLDFLIASRLHGLILALLVQCPVIAVAGNRKVAQLMRDVQLEQWNIAMEAVTRDDLVRLATEIRAQHTSLADGIGRYNAAALGALRILFGQVADLVHRA